MEGQPLVSEGKSGEQAHSKLLCVMVGNGIQIAGIAVAWILSSAFGLESPWSSKGLLITGMIVAHLLSATVAGYACVWLWRCINGSSEGWSSVSWYNSCAFFSAGFAIFTVLSIVQYLNDGSADISLPCYFAFLALWIFVSIPLTHLGGFIATRYGEPTLFPLRTFQNKGETQTRELWSWLLVLVGGLLSFGAVAFELYFALINSAFGTFNRAFPVMLILSLLVVISCAIVSLGLTYWCLVYEDPTWWWKAFLGSGSAGLYMYVLMVKYYVIDQNGSKGPTSVVMYLGISAILCAAITLFTGTVGFLSAFGFLRVLSFLGNLRHPISAHTKISQSEMCVSHV